MVQTLVNLLEEVREKDIEAVRRKEKKKEREVKRERTEDEGESEWEDEGTKVKVKRVKRVALLDHVSP